MKLAKYCTRIIEYSFYIIFFLVPLVFSGATSELFEFNKMWLTFSFTAIIVAAWASKMVFEKKIFIQRTPFDIPIMLFLLSQIISTVISLDQHVSWWGYYSRFNGGLLSTLTYIVLYYAFVTNFKLKHVFNLLKVTLASGFITALWGFPAHFGADPTCLLMQGKMDTTCWTEAFQPTVRTFSTLGQPAWFAAYLALLIPISMAYALKQTSAKVWIFIGLAVFFYLNLIFANTRAGFIAFWAANAFFWAILFYKNLFPKQNFIRAFVLFNAVFIISSFLLGSPLGPLTKFTLPSLTSQPVVSEETTPSGAPATPVPGSGITDSGDIRLFVWQGALDAWKSSPVFGTGVETFAFAYYKFKPAGHNMTSEWDYLYNKAHNEYLNYLTTTGLFGLGTYLVIIGLFIFTVLRHVLITHRRTPEEKHGVITESVVHQLIIIALLTSFITILITNFFGFSVVIMNLYLFIIPALVLILGDLLKENHALQFNFGEEHTNGKHHVQTVNPFQWTLVLVFAIIAGWQVIGLMIFSQADVAYALGSNLDKTGNFQQAYPQLIQAVETKPDEPVFKDELSINLAAIAAGLYAQGDATNAAQLAKNSIDLNTEVVTNHPNNVVYWKNRVRMFYTLSTTDQANSQQYMLQALNAINKAKELAPTDAKIAYNQGILYGQTGDLKKAVSILEETIKLKPNYKDAYVALGLFYHQMAIDQNEKIVNPEMQKKAVDTYTFILEKLDPTDQEVKKTLKDWQQS